jgi:hypothetical protein
MWTHWRPLVEERHSHFPGWRGSLHMRDHHHGNGYSTRPRPLGGTLSILSAIERIQGYPLVPLSRSDSSWLQNSAHVKVDFTEIQCYLEHMYLWLEILIQRAWEEVYHTLPCRGDHWHSIGPRLEAIGPRLPHIFS